MGLRLKRLCALGGRLDPAVTRSWRTCFGPGCWQPIRPCIGTEPVLGGPVHPGPLLGDLFLTGYYPVFQWIAYLLVGLVIGRLALTTVPVPFLLLAVGTAVAVLAKALGYCCHGGLGRPRSAGGTVLNAPAYPLESVLQVNLTGIEQAGSVVVAGVRCTAFRHHPGPAAHVGGGRGRGRRVPPARQAGGLAGP